MVLAPKAFVNLKMEKDISNLGYLNFPKLSWGKQELMIKKQTYQMYEKTSHHVWKSAETTNQRFELNKLLEIFVLYDIEYNTLMCDISKK